MGAYKQFSTTLYETNDSAACNQVLEFLHRNEVQAVRNLDQYGPDIRVFGATDAEDYFVECEIKQAWRAGQEQFPFSEANLPERKRKFIHLGLPIEFWILRADLGAALLILDKSLSEERLTEVPNKYVGTGELFFRIPLEECRMINLGVTNE